MKTSMRIWCKQVTLLNIDEELDTGMRRRFDREDLKEIRSEFDKVFREVFGGGHGNLELWWMEKISWKRNPDYFQP